TYVEPLDDQYLHFAGLQRAYELATKAVICDPNLPFAHSQLGSVLMFKRRYDEAIAEFERAVSLNPNFTDYQFGLNLVYVGQAERAIETLKTNLRLDPFLNASRLGHMGHAYYMLKRYLEAVTPLRECASRLPDLRIVHLWLAAAYAQLGWLTEAGAEAA